VLTPEQNEWIQNLRDRAKEMSVGDQLNLMTMHPVKMVALCDMALAHLEAAKQGEAFQCPACGAAIKAPQPPASQGGVIEAAWREAAQFALGRFGALGKDNIGVGVENTVSNLRARKQHQAALAPSVKEKP
jgi:hypothetical protein